MPARRSPFKQADATKALRAAERAGMKPSGYRITPEGAIEVMFGSAPPAGANSFDSIMGGRQ